MSVARAALGIGLLVGLLPAPTLAQGFTDIGQDVRPREATEFEIHGALRLRGEALVNLDLDRGLTPSGVPLFAVPPSDPTAQTLTHGDMRLRTDLAIHAPFGGVAVKARLDILDNLALGSTPEAEPLFSNSQAPPDEAIRVERVWGEALTPVGFLAAGRMGSHWGLGILTHGGDCADCDSGDAADRVALVTPLFGHVWAVAFDMSGTGPLATRPAAGRTLDLDPDDDIRGLTFALMNVRTDQGRERRRAAGKTTLEYGAIVASQWQSRDAPAAYLPLEAPTTLDRAQFITRDYQATAIDGWFRLTTPWMRLEAEVAWLQAQIAQASLIPGVELAQEATSDQLGAAMQSAFGDPDGALLGGLDAGFASGDAAPGFGVRVDPGTGAGQPGDLDGAQASFPNDTTVDNFRFHPDYRVDRILFRELIGTVTDAVYLRPHIRWRAAQVGSGELTLALAVVASWAVEPTSTPGGQRALGLELDPTLVYESRDGFQLALEHATLLPMAGLDNAQTGQEATAAHLWRVRLGFFF